MRIPGELATAPVTTNLWSESIAGAHPELAGLSGGSTSLGVVRRGSVLLVVGVRRRARSTECYNCLIVHDGRVGWVDLP